MNQIVIFVIQALGGRENLDILSQRCTGTVWEPFKPENRFGSANLAINKFHFFMYEICPFHPRFYFFLKYLGMNRYNEQITYIMNISTMFIIRVNL